MTNASRLLSMLALSFVANPAFASSSPNDDCTVLDSAFRQARTEFPTLKNRQFGGALCKFRKNDFKCGWDFPTDKYGDADIQIDRLERCAAAHHDAQLLEKGHHQATFQMGPDTKVVIRGPVPNNGDWEIQLEITTSADWN